MHLFVLSGVVELEDCVMGIIMGVLLIGWFTDDNL
jgi:hypothetical protein